MSHSKIWLELQNFVVNSVFLFISICKAPEIVNFDPITFATDMWAIGVITYILLTGISPFAGDTQIETFQNILDCYVEYDRDEMDDVSQLAKDFIKRLLVRNPKKRATVQECLDHPWIKPKDNKQIISRRSSTIIRDKLSHLKNFVVSSPATTTTLSLQVTSNSPGIENSSNHFFPMTPSSKVHEVEDTFINATENIDPSQLSESKSPGIEAKIEPSDPLIEIPQPIKSPKLINDTSLESSKLYSPKMDLSLNDESQVVPLDSPIKISDKDLVNKELVNSESNNTITIEKSVTVSKKDKSHTKDQQNKESQKSPKDKSSEQPGLQQQEQTTPTSNWKSNFRTGVFDRIGAAFNAASNAITNSIQTINSSPTHHQIQVQSKGSQPPTSSTHSSVGNRKISKGEESFNNLPFSALDLNKPGKKENGASERSSHRQSLCLTTDGKLADRFERGRIFSLINSSQSDDLIPSNINKYESDFKRNYQNIASVNKGITNSLRQKFENQTNGEKVAIMTTSLIMPTTTESVNKRSHQPVKVLKGSDSKTSGISLTSKFPWKS